MSALLNFSIQRESPIRLTVGYPEELTSNCWKFFVEKDKDNAYIAKNIEVERPKVNADSVAELILTFFTGLSMEHNLSSSRASIVRKIEDLMNTIRTL